MDERSYRLENLEKENISSLTVKTEMFLLLILKLYRSH